MPGDVLSAVMTPEQLADLWEINNEVLSLLTPEQRKKVNDKEDILLIISELDPAKQEQITQLAQNVFSSLNDQQKLDVMFLGSGMLDGEDLATRLAILNHLKDNDGEITYDDLVDIGVYAPGTLADGGIIRWLQNLDYGGPAHFGELLEKEHQLNGFGTSFGQLDKEYRMQQAEQRTLLLAMAAAPIINRLLSGRTLR